VTEKTFVTDNYIPHYENGIAWLVEPPAIFPNPYNWIKDNHKKYKYVLTYSQELLSLGENFLFYPFGNTLLNESDFNLYQQEKKHLVSMVISHKDWTEGHKLRHKLKSSLNNNVDLLGSGVDGRYTPKIESCKNYMFQIVVENSKYDYYFTEKIMDCFLTGVIPIYWGTSKVNELFDSNGIINFDSEKDLMQIIDSLDEKLYEEKRQSILNNFELSKEYTYSENWIYNQYKFLF
jgi:Mor family transcriptional regulator